MRAALAMPQAIERLLATPMIRPRLPRMRRASAMDSLGRRTLPVPAACYGIGLLDQQADGAHATESWNIRQSPGVFSLRKPAKDVQVSGFRQDIQATIPALRRYARALTRDTEI